MSCHRLPCLRHPAENLAHLVRRKGAERLGSDVAERTDAQEQRFRVLNGLTANQSIVPGQKVKLVVRAR